MDKQKKEKKKLLKEKTRCNISVRCNINVRKNNVSDINYVLRK